MSKKLSIIVPVYNMAAEGKLNYCLDSLVGQTIRGVYDYEILCVDDASTDESLEILLDYQKRYPELICVIPNAVNLRQGGAKNVGLKNAEGEWIGFIDSDDWVSPDYYEKLLKKAEETGADLVGCDYSLVDHHTFTVGKVIVNNTPEQTGELTTEQHRSLFMRPGSMVLKIYKHSVIRENHLDFPEHIFYEDNCAGPLWSLYFQHFARVEEPLYYYYQHAVSTVHHITEEKCRDRMKAAELLYTECERRGFLTEYSREIEYRYTELYYAITLFSYMGGVTHPKLAFIRQLRKGVEERFPEFAQNPYYLERTGAPEQKLIRDFNLTVKPGQRVAIVGPTGCGKTTVINLLMRFYDVNAGSIKVDDIDIREMTRKSLRAGYGMKRPLFSHFHQYPSDELHFPVPVSVVLHQSK